MAIKSDVSIIVVNWNALEYLKLLIKSLKENTLCDFSLYILDNNSRKDSVHYLRNIHREIDAKVIFLPQNIGYAAGNNKVFKIIKTKYVCLLNSDVYVSAGWLEQLKIYYNNDKKIKLIGPSSNTVKDVMSPNGMSLTERWEKFKKENKRMSNTPPIKILESFYGKNIDYEINKIKNVNSSKGVIKYNSLPSKIGCSCVLFEKSFIEKELDGVLFRKEFLSGGEDIDLSWRIIKRGYSIARSFNAFVHHFQHASMKDSGVLPEYFFTTADKNLATIWKKDLLRIKKKSDFLNKLLNYIK